jgi:hypothetical protein
MLNVINHQETQINMEEETSTHPIEWAKLKMGDMPSVDQDVEKLELPNSAGGTLSDTTTLENCLAGSTKARCMPTRDPATPLLDIAATEICSCVL